MVSTAHMGSAIDAVAAIANGCGGGFNPKEMQLGLAREDAVLIEIVATGISRTDFAAPDWRRNAFLTWPDRRHVAIKRELRP